MRWITFTLQYPNAAMPVNGVFVRERLRALLRRSGGDAVVVAPAPWFPPIRGFGRWSRWARVPLTEQDGEVQILHPRYPLIPKLSTPIHPLLLQASVESDIGRIARNASLIDAHFLYPDGVAAVRIGQRLDLPVVLTARGIDVNVFARMPVLRTWIRYALSRAAAVIAVSEDLRRCLAETTGMSQELIDVVPNGVDGSRFKPGDRGAARRALGLSQTDRIVLCVGELVAGKRVDVVLRALARLQPGRRPFLVCVGDGPRRKPLERLARRCGLAGRVRFVGEQPPDMMPSWYRAADAFVLASDREGCPNVVLEALASGLPVLASRVGGVPELVDTQVGILVDTNAPQAFALGIEKLERQRFDPAAFECRTKQHSWVTVGDRLKLIFERLAARRS